MAQTLVQGSQFKERFKGAAWFEHMKVQTIMLLGAGGIGSWVALALSRIGCDLMIYDMDTVEAVNLGGQFYGHKDIGKNKGVATRDNCYRNAGEYNSIFIDNEYTEDSPTNDVIVAAFDNMAARKLAFYKWKKAVLRKKKEERKNCLFIDGRLLAEDYQIYAVTEDRMNEYEATLFDDSEVEEEDCTMKATSHCSMSIASDIVSVLTNFYTNRALNQDARIVPFNITKNIMFFGYEVNQ